MKNLYKKIAPVIAKIALIALIVSLVGMVAASVLQKELTDPWHIYYAALAGLLLNWAAIGFGVVYVLFDLCRIWRWVKERLRKMVVYLKRNPSTIPLLTLAAAFLVYSLNLTHVSDTTARIQGSGMGIAQFCMMLFTILSMVCMLNAFPRRKKANVPMLIIMFVLLGVVLISDVHYRNAIWNALYRPESPIELTDYILKAFNMLNTYMGLIIATIVLVILLPLYSKLLKLINTSVELEDNGAMEEIEISE